MSFPEIILGTRATRQNGAKITSSPGKPNIPNTALNTHKQLADCLCTDVCDAIGIHLPEDSLELLKVVKKSERLSKYMPSKREKKREMSAKSEAGKRRNIGPLG